MPRGTVDGQDLELIRVFPRRLLSGRISYIAKMDLWIAGSRILEVDRALQTLRKRKPDASLSTLVCDAIVQASKIKG
jgi:hypothetical protein